MRKAICGVAYAFVMRVRVLYFGALKDGFGREGEWLELADGASVADLVRVCRERLAGAVWDSIAVAVNREYAQGSVLLKDGDEVALLPPVSGGLPPETCSPGQKKYWGSSPSLRSGSE
ncbi:MoaD/ThiS family protein [Edaphobacter acidisoli]|uniref:MoaD/ThiS family protein n=1 Tax=Edaphobacter acidisoli TaxID=2040573 RepID=UPI001E58AB5C|nr:MoaD/ThiS family protein [Edaphobacter acidisoli]